MTTALALTALIGAYEPGPGPGGLRALVPLAGAPLVEHQARRAIAAGARRVLLLVETVPPELAEVVGRLRRDGITLGMAEDIGTAADALPQDDPVLLIADACLPEIELLASVAEARAPALATLPDTPDFAQHERIDASSRWAGIALLDGRRIGETAAMIGSWDPVSTLLRRAVQEGAARVTADAMPPVLLLDVERQQVAEDAIVDAARRRGSNWIQYHVFDRIEEAALPLLLHRRVEATPLALGAMALVLLGALLAVGDWRRLGLVALLASGPVAAIAARVARVRDRPILRASWLEAGRLLGIAIGGIALAGRLWMASGQWGWGLVALCALIGMGFLTLQRRVSGPAPFWYATADGLVWAMLPFALLGRFDLGLVLAELYIWVSFTDAMRRLTFPRPAPPAP